MTRPPRPPLDRWSGARCAGHRGGGASPCADRTPRRALSGGGRNDPWLPGAASSSPASASPGTSPARSPRRWPAPARPAYFVHAAEASHGDLGMITPTMCSSPSSNSGESEELLRIVPLLKRGRARADRHDRRSADSTLAARPMSISTPASPRSLPAQPRADRQHHGGPRAGRCAGRRPARCARVLGGRLRAFPSRRHSGQETADPCARRHAHR